MHMLFKSFGLFSILSAIQACIYMIISINPFQIISCNSDIVLSSRSWDAMLLCHLIKNSLKNYAFLLASDMATLYNFLDQSAL